MTSPASVQIDFYIVAFFGFVSFDTVSKPRVLSSIPQVDLWGEIPQQRISEFLSLTVVYHGKSNDVTAVGSINSFVHKIGANLNPCIFRETESQDRNISEQKMPGEKILAPENPRYFFSF